MVNYQTSQYELLIFLLVLFRRFSMRQRNITSYSLFRSHCIYCQLRRLVFNQNSPLQPVSESRGGWSERDSGGQSPEILGLILNCGLEKYCIECEDCVW